MLRSPSGADLPEEPDSGIVPLQIKSIEKPLENNGNQWGLDLNEKELNSRILSKKVTLESGGQSINLDESQRVPIQKF